MPNEKPELIEEDGEPVGTLPLGTIAMSQVNTELGRPSTQGIDLNDGGVRTLAEAGAGQISMSQLQGKTATFKAIFYSSEAQVNLFNWLTARGWNQSAPVEVTINGGVYIYSDNPVVPALTVNGSYPSGLKIINHGIIMGRGGDGEITAELTGPFTNANGGHGISIQAWNVSFASDGYVCGGGGGGESQPKESRPYGVYIAGGGGGAGGGRGGARAHTDDISGYEPVPPATYDAESVYGGGGGGLGGAGGNGTHVARFTQVTRDGIGGSMGGGGGTYDRTSGGGGGRSVTYNQEGSGAIYLLSEQEITGGTGGAYNNAGGDSYKTYSGQTYPWNQSAGGGGGYGAMGGNLYPRQLTSGYGGNAIALNGYSVNFQSYGTIWGAIN